LEEYMEEKLLITESKMLRKIFGSSKERNGTLRNKRNDELIVLNIII
jgi:hypothetical protein